MKFTSLLSSRRPQDEPATGVECDYDYRASTGKFTLLILQDQVIVEEGACWVGVTLLKSWTSLWSSGRLNGVSLILAILGNLHFVPNWDGGFGNFKNFSNILMIQWNIKKFYLFLEVQKNATANNQSRLNCEYFNRLNLRFRKLTLRAHSFQKNHYLVRPLFTSSETDQSWQLYRERRTCFLFGNYRLLDLFFTVQGTRCWFSSRPGGHTRETSLKIDFFLLSTSRLFFSSFCVLKVRIFGWNGTVILTCIISIYLL